MQNRRGLDELTRKVWQRRRDLQRDNRLDGTLQEVRELLDKALRPGAGSPGPAGPGDDARFREMELDTLPGDTGGAVRELGKYDWQSRDARETFLQQIQDLLGREMLDQRFAGMKQALEHATPAGRAGDPGDAGRPERICCRRTPGWPTPPSSSRSSWTSTGDFFPENPQHHRGADRSAGREIRRRATDDELA